MSDSDESMFSGSESEHSDININHAALESDVSFLNVAQF